VFGGTGGEDLMHHLINGSTADGAYTQEQDKTVVEEEEEVGEEGGEDEEPVVAVAPMTTEKGKGKKKAAPKKGGGSRGPKWRSLEDECLAEAWKTVSIDHMSSANQHSDTYCGDPGLPPGIPVMHRIHDPRKTIVNPHNRVGSTEYIIHYITSS
jgi:hypothetical protein